MRARREGSQVHREGSQNIDEVHKIANITGAVKVEGKYPPIVYALADPERREKLRTICQHLSVKGKRNYLKGVWYGCGYKPVTMFTVDRLLEAVR